MIDLSPMRGVAVDQERCPARVEGGATWTQHHSLCETDERLARLAETTGGRPYLLGKALQLRDRRPDQDRVLADLTSWLEQSSGADQFVDAVGLLENDILKAAYDGVVEQLGTDWHDDACLVTAAGMAGLSSGEPRGRRLPGGSPGVRPGRDAPVRGAGSPYGVGRT
ncbi:hypothetical protein [Streptomyces sp. NPDC093591]|uniref:hypothetical protein n=1 Tax=Streptomyces sp. NPDC093591 TaxID=3366044 RepID=UPI00381CF6E6